jgi:hypothetical protein
MSNLSHTCECMRTKRICNAISDRLDNRAGPGICFLVNILRALVRRTARGVERYPVFVNCVAYSLLLLLSFPCQRRGRPSDS